MVSVKTQHVSKMPLVRARIMQLGAVDHDLSLDKDGPAIFEMDVTVHSLREVSVPVSAISNPH